MSAVLIWVVFFVSCVSLNVARAASYRRDTNQVQDIASLRQNIDDIFVDQTFPRSDVSGLQLWNAAYENSGFEPLVDALAFYGEQSSRPTLSGNNGQITGSIVGGYPSTDPRGRQGSEISPKTSIQLKVVNKNRGKLNKPQTGIAGSERQMSPTKTRGYRRRGISPVAKTVETQRGEAGQNNNVIKPRKRNSGTGNEYFGTNQSGRNDQQTGGTGLKKPGAYPRTRMLPQSNYNGQRSSSRSRGEPNVYLQPGLSRGYLPGDTSQHRGIVSPQSNTQLQDPSQQNGGVYPQGNTLLRTGPSQQRYGEYPQINSQLPAGPSQQGDGAYPQINSQLPAGPSQQRYGAYPRSNSQISAGPSQQGDGAYPQIDSQRRAGPSQQRDGAYPRSNSQLPAGPSPQGDGAYPRSNSRLPTDPSQQGDGAYPRSNSQLPAGSSQQGDSAYPRSNSQIRAGPSQQGGRLNYQTNNQLRAVPNQQGSGLFPQANTQQREGASGTERIYRPTEAIGQQNVDIYPKVNTQTRPRPRGNIIDGSQPRNGNKYLQSLTNEQPNGRFFSGSKNGYRQNRGNKIRGDIHSPSSIKENQNHNTLPYPTLFESKQPYNGGFSNTGSKVPAGGILVLQQQGNSDPAFQNKRTSNYNPQSPRSNIQLTPQLYVPNSGDNKISGSSAPGVARAQGGIDNDVTRYQQYRASRPQTAKSQIIGDPSPATTGATYSNVPLPTEHTSRYSSLVKRGQPEATKNNEQGYIPGQFDNEQQNRYNAPIRKTNDNSKPKQRTGYGQQKLNIPHDSYSLNLLNENNGQQKMFPGPFNINQIHTRPRQVTAQASRYDQQQSRSPAGELINPNNNDNELNRNTQKRNGQQKQKPTRASAEVNKPKEARQTAREDRKPPSDRTGSAKSSPSNKVGRLDTSFAPANMYFSQLEYPTIIWKQLTGPRGTHRFPYDIQERGSRFQPSAYVQ